MFCPYCAKEIPNESKVCGYCGKKIEVQPPAPPTEPAPVPEPKPPVEPALVEPPAAPQTAAPSSEKQAIPTWVWGIVGVVVVVVIIGGALLMSRGNSSEVAVVENDQKSQSNAVTATPRSQNSQFETSAFLLDLPCQTHTQNWANVRSGWSANSVQVDGQVTNEAEWSDATCIDAAIGDPQFTNGNQFGGDPISARWWFKNDEDWLYMLVLVSMSEAREPFAAIYYYWGGHSAANGWQHSDGGIVGYDGGSWDQCCWDESDWYEDVDIGGTFDTDAAASKDGSYFLMEFKHPMDSGDEYDWSWHPGEMISNENSSLLIGIWDKDGSIWREANLNFTLAQK